MPRAELWIAGPVVRDNRASTNSFCQNKPSTRAVFVTSAWNCGFSWAIPSRCRLIERLSRHGPDLCISVCNMQDSIDFIRVLAGGWLACVFVCLRGRCLPCPCRPVGSSLTRSFVGLLLE